MVGPHADTITMQSAVKVIGGDGGGAVVIINYPSECVREGGYYIHV